MSVSLKQPTTDNHQKLLETMTNEQLEQYGLLQASLGNEDATKICLELLDYRNKFQNRYLLRYTSDSGISSWTHLHGVTGTSKEEIYLHAKEQIAKYLSGGKTYPESLDNNLKIQGKKIDMDKDEMESFSIHQVITLDEFYDKYADESD
jgi:hypothetical protein